MSAVATLRPGDPVDGVYACTRKDRLVTRTGSPYLALELRDKTGTIPARAFRDADVLAGRFERGDLVRVRGRVERFRSELQLDLERIARAEGAEADPRAFLPASYRDLDELEAFYEHLGDEITDAGFRRLVGRVLAEDAMRSELRRAPASPSAHHAYLGGLLEHSVAVAQLCLELCSIHPRLESDLLLTAALLHDLGRTREFTYGATIALTPEGRLLGHLALGQRLLEERMDGLDDLRRTALLHCVLGHHGADALPGKRFGSAEAVALHRANALDAGVKGALEPRVGDAGA